jgi:predicted NBD/HSP70 family sugar kinase
MMPSAPGSLEALRQLNRLRVLDALRRRGGASRVELVRETGLSRTTVSSLVSALLHEGIVVERADSQSEPPDRSRGRPAVRLTLNPSAGGVLGVDFGHQDVRVGVADLACTLLADARQELDVDHQPAEAMSAATDLATMLLDRVGLARERVAGAGAAVSAPLHGPSHRLASTAIFPGWAGVDVQTELEARLGMPVAVGNDANLGALAESTFGAGRNVDDLLYIMLGAGVGAGIIIGGRIYEGANGTAGELGHVVATPDGMMCRCGNRGCLETVAGAQAITHALAHSHDRPLTIEDLLSLAHGGDAAARRVLGDAGRVVGTAVAGLCSVLDPSLIIIGGDVAAAGEVLLEGIRESISRGTTPATGGTYRVVSGELGARAETLGAIALVMNNAPAAAILHAEPGPMPPREQSAATV